MQADSNEKKKESEAVSASLMAAENSMVLTYVPLVVAEDTIHADSKTQSLNSPCKTWIYPCKTLKSFPCKLMGYALKKVAYEDGIFDSLSDLAENSNQFLHLGINHDDWSQQLKATFVYAKSTWADRKELWESLCSIRANLVDL
ncbi:hypothetical protein ACH5RR_029634 [Cinchona calisaya]|uniref:Uncharacterized protein n=1 Tax=Cinchona calisaya TaxID=153742 RepID=A0ABD2YTG1_9GENT